MHINTSNVYKICHSQRKYFYLNVCIKSNVKRSNVVNLMFKENYKVVLQSQYKLWQLCKFHDIPIQ